MRINNYDNDECWGDDIDASMSRAESNAESIDDQIKKLLEENPDVKFHISGGSLETMDDATKEMFLNDLKRATETESE